MKKLVTTLMTAAIAVGLGLGTIGCSQPKEGPVKDTSTKDTPAKDWAKKDK